MSDFSAIHQGTGQGRLQFWSMGLSAFFRNPIAGIGPGEYLNYVGKACHNSFVQAYAELGFFGGTLFLAAFYLAALMTIRIGQAHTRVDEPFMQSQSGVYVVPALIMAYVTAILTLNHLYGPVTYLVLAMSSAVTMVYGRGECDAPGFALGGLMTQMATVSCAFIAVVYVSCLLLVNW
jgi:O-antigen ligase